MTDWLLLLGGGLLLYFGAEWLVSGASSLALALRVPQIIVGLTVVAYGTSTPEVIVGIQAAITGHGDVALGNVIGSNIANVGLILGLAALIRPPRVHGSLRRRELPALMLTAVAVPVLLLDGRVGRAEGAVLVACAVAYTAWMAASARAASAAERRRKVQVTASASDSAGGPKVRGPLASSLIAAVGLVVLLVGGRFFVIGAVEVARVLGVSERIIGLTVVAVGTSLPELVTSVVAGLRGHSDIAVGNVVGSNIFNVLLCLGTAALARPLSASPGRMLPELVMLLAMTAACAVLVRSERTISRREGAAALLMYVAFTVYLVASGGEPGPAGDPLTPASA